MWPAGISGFTEVEGERVQQLKASLPTVFHVKGGILDMVLCNVCVQVTLSTRDGNPPLLPVPNARNPRNRFTLYKTTAPSQKKPLG